LAERVQPGVDQPGAGDGPFARTVVDGMAALAGPLLAMPREDIADICI
jgi:hypothetical protein